MEFQDETELFVALLFTNLNSEPDDLEETFEQVLGIYHNDQTAHEDGHRQWTELLAAHLRVLTEEFGHELTQEEIDEAGFTYTIKVVNSVVK